MNAVLKSLNDRAAIWLGNNEPGGHGDKARAAALCPESRFWLERYNQPVGDA